MDLLAVTAVVAELKRALEGALLSRVVQTAPEVVVLEWWARGRGERRLVVSAEPEAPRLHLTALPASRLRDLPPPAGGPPRFCAYLRAHAEGARLLEVAQLPGERVVRFRLGQGAERLDLVAELLGSHAQLLVVGADGRVREALRRVGGAGRRRLAPGDPYLPPPPGSLRPLADLPAIAAEVLGSETAGAEARILTAGAAAGRLARAVAGVTRPLAAHLLAAARRGGTPPDGRRLAAAARDLVGQVEAARFEPRIYRPAEVPTEAPAAPAAGQAAEPGVEQAAVPRSEQAAVPGTLSRAGQVEPGCAAAADSADAPGAPIAEPLLAMLPLAHLEPEPGRPVHGVAVEPFESPSAAVEAFYASEADRLARRAAPLGSRLLKARERLVRRLSALAADRGNLERAADARRLGDLLAAQRGLLRKGQREARLVDLLDPAAPTVTVPLDPALGPQGNIDAYYARARRARRGLEAVAARQAETEAELAYLDQALYALEAAEEPADLAALEAELAEQGLVPAPRLAPSARSAVARRAAGAPGRTGALRPAAEPPLRRFRSSDGFEIVAGKSNAGNDYVSTRLARPDDLWLHAEGYPGAHVLVRRRSAREEIPERTVLEAAALAALYSRARGATKVPVHVAPASSVRKPRGARPGLVTLTGGHRTVVVAPDPDLPARLTAASASSSPEPPVEA